VDSIAKILEEKSAQNTPNEVENCEVCGEPAREWVEYQGSKFTIAHMCACRRKKMEEEEERERREEKLRKIEKLKSLSLLGKRYRDVTFENSKTGLNSSFDTAFNRCKKYCEVYEEVLEKGMGIYLFGDKGVGKTHITACIANEFLKSCVPVLLTNLFEISKAIKSTFRRESAETEQMLFNRFAQVDFLFFDDLGTEVFSKNADDTWMQTLLFDLINERYNSGKPTIFSSNYSLNDLINKRGVAEKTVDRISEMTSGAIMKIQGESWRKKISDKGIPF
jgi:DNA replication protein DnaC